MEHDIRWGFVGPGRIARRLAEEWPLVEGARIAGVASRDSGRAQDFAREFGIERVYGDYAALFADPEIDIVYLAVPHNFHRPLALEAMAAGKAVFCEKPMGVSAPEVLEMVEAAQRRKVFLMEAVRTRFMPALHRAIEWVEAGRIGAPALLQAFFCFDGGNDPQARHLNPDLAGGALLDIGVYPLTLAELLLGPEPVETLATGQFAETGVDASCGIMVRYADGVVAQLNISIARAAGVHARLWGSEGCLDLPAFHGARKVTLVSGERTETFEQAGPGLFCFEIEEANRCLREGRRESPRMTHAASLRMARWLDAIQAQLKGPVPGP